MQPTVASSENDEPVLVRRLWPQERSLWEEHLLRLNREDRRLRFTGTTSDAAIRQHCAAADFLDTVLYGAFIDGALRGVGECCLLQREWPRRAELAFSVESRWRGLGIGTLLFGRLVTFARNRTLGRLDLVTVSGNRPMQAIAARFGMHLNNDAGEVEGRLRLRWPSYSSVLEEAVAEGEAWWQQIRQDLPRCLPLACA